MSPTVALAAAGSYSSGDRLTSKSRLSKESQAIFFFFFGLAQRDKATKYEQKAAKYDRQDKSHKKFLAKADKAYRKAIEKYKRALNYDNQMFQAHTSLGYALRKIGLFDESLMSYENALHINPNYAEAIEYKAQAHLQLHQYDEVKRSYLTLRRDHPEYADKLSTAIKNWLRNNGKNRSNRLQAFAQWASYL